MLSYFLYLVGYGETAEETTPRNEEATVAQEPSTSNTKNEINKLESGLLPSGEYESDGSSSGSDYLPHDHGLYGPTSKALFKKRYVERNFGLGKKPSLNTPLIKFTLALTQLCIIIDAALFSEVLLDHTNDLEKVVEKLALEHINNPEMGDFDKWDYFVNNNCESWTTLFADMNYEIVPFLADLYQHIWWNFLVFSILIPEYLIFNTAMQVLGKDCPTIWSFILMMSGLISWAVNCIKIEHKVPEEGKFGGFRSYTNCHIYLGYMLHAFFVLFAATVIIQFIAKNCTTIYKIRLVGKVLQFILPGLKNDVLLTFPLVTEVFVIASGHYAVQYYSTIATKDRTDKDVYLKEETRLSLHISFHLGTCFGLLFTEFLKHQATFHDKRHVIDRKTFKENFMQFLPMYKPGGPLAGPPYTWTDDWMIQMKKHSKKQRQKFTTP